MIKVEDILTHITQIRWEASVDEEENLIWTSITGIRVVKIKNERLWELYVIAENGYKTLYADAFEVYHLFPTIQQLVEDQKHENEKPH